MSDSKFRFNKNIPVEILPSLETNLERLKFLIPAWCQLVHVYYVTDPSDENLADGAVASSSCSYAYRTGCIYFHPNYFYDDEEERFNTCIHELVHLSVNILGDYASNAVKQLLPEEDSSHRDSSHRKMLLDELESRVEAAVVDLTFIIQKLKQNSK